MRKSQGIKEKKKPSSIFKYTKHLKDISPLFETNLSGKLLLFLSPWKWRWKSLSCVQFFVPHGYTVPGILQARVLEWVAFPFSRVSSQPRGWIQVFHITGGFFTSSAARKAQEYWSGQPIPSPGDRPNPGINPESPALQVDSLPIELWGKPI